jgi:hypothetical protein
MCVDELHPGSLASCVTVRVLAVSLKEPKRKYLAKYVLGRLLCPVGDSFVTAHCGGTIDMNRFAS